MKKFKNRNQTIGMRILILSISSLILWGCMPQSKYSYEVPGMEEGTYRTLESSHDTTDSTTIADIQWRTFFNDTNLIQLIDKGLQYNFDILQAVKNIEIADQYFKQKKLEWLPSVSGTIAKANYEILSDKSFASPNSTFYDGGTPPENLFVYKPQNITGLNFSWEIDIWGKIRSEKAAALFEYGKTHEMKKAVQTKLISDIAEGYYNLLLLNAQLKVAEQNFQLSENTFKIVSLQYNSANVTALAKSQVKSQMLIYKALIPKLKEKIAIQENALSFLTGGLPDSFNQLAFSLWNVPMDTAYSYGVPLQLIDNRPDVQLKKLDLLKKNAEVGVAQTAQYPQLKIDIDFGLNAALARNWLSIPGALFGNIIGGLTQPIFNKRKLKTNFNVAKINREKAELDFQKTAYNAVREVSDALIHIHSLEEQFDIVEEQVTTTELSIRQADMLFNSGYATYLEVITAQEVALKSELQFNEIRHDLLLARVRLYRALGGGWK